MKKTHLITIDPQNDFCTPKGPSGETAALYVDGAEDDIDRLAKFFTKNYKRIEDVHCTLDSHQSIHIAHPIFWRNSKGDKPGPFTTITHADVVTGTWQSRDPSYQKHCLHYTAQLEKNGRYQLMIWPPHCLIGSWGHAMVPKLHAAFKNWEEDTFSKVDFVAKGSNFLTEHYSAVQADVPDDKDPSTKLNTALIDTLNEADEILITGEALSHCVANSIRDIAKAFGDDNIKKFVLLTDTSSNVKGCNALGLDFIKEMTSRGMKETTTKDW
jgi:nicotinamidase-related amidase